MRYKSHYNTDDYEVQVKGQVYTCGVEAHAVEEHEPGHMYTRNGDPGNPPYNDFDIDKLELRDVRDMNGNEVKDEDLLDEIEQVVMDELGKNIEWFKVDDYTNRED